MSAGEYDLASRAHWRLGTTLKGKYRIERVLGAGGAFVYKATRPVRALVAIGDRQGRIVHRDTAASLGSWR